MQRALFAERQALEFFELLNSMSWSKILFLDIYWKYFQIYVHIWIISCLNEAVACEYVYDEESDVPWQEVTTFLEDYGDDDLCNARNGPPVEPHS